MSWLDHWWVDEVIDGGKLPIMLCFLAFVVTFTVTRTITRMIRAGKGPFRNVVSAGGTHIHHAVPGIVALIAGAFLSVTEPSRTTVAVGSVAAVLIGVGTSLVLDEFALILHLTDVYWTNEGRVSVDTVSLAAACLGLAAVGVSPLDLSGISTLEAGLRISAGALLVANIALVLVCVVKGKYPIAALAIFVPLLSVVGAIRLARPESVWARHRYRGTKLARAQARSADIDRRFDPLLRVWDNLIGGRPNAAPMTGAAAVTPAATSRSDAAAGVVPPGPRPADGTGSSPEPPAPHGRAPVLPQLPDTHN